MVLCGSESAFAIQDFHATFHIDAVTVVSNQTHDGDPALEQEGLASPDDRRDDLQPDKCKTCSQMMMMMMMMMVMKIKIVAMIFPGVTR